MDCWHQAEPAQLVQPSQPTLPLTWVCWVELSCAERPQEAHLCQQEEVLDVFISRLNSLTWV